MLMDSFEVENFRSLKHLKLEKLARVNLLVGKNNVGKTSVLEALYSLAGISTPIWFDNLVREREMNPSEATFFHLFYNLNDAESIKLSASYAHSPLSTEYKMWLSAILQLADSTSKQVVDELEWGSTPSVRQSILNSGLSIELQTDSMTLPAHYKLVPIENRNFRRFTLEALVEGALEAARGIRVTNAFRSRAAFVSSHPRLRNLSSSIEQLKISKIDDELVEVLRQIDSRIERIELVGNGQIYFNLGPTFPALLPANLMGDGIQRLLMIVSAIISKSGGLVLIDEIDNGLHYSAMRVLWKGILYASRKYDVQIVATTHSAEALRHLTWVLDDAENANYRDDVAAYTLIRADDDTVRSYRHDYEQLDYALDHGLEIRN